MALRRQDERTKALRDTMSELGMDEPRRRFAAMMSGPLLHDARPVVLNFAERGGFDITPWADRVRSIDAKHSGAWELQALGEVAAPTAVSIRPDGYVGWVAELTERGLADVLTTWCGPPAAAWCVGSQQRRAVTFKGVRMTCNMSLTGEVDQLFRATRMPFRLRG